MKNWMMLLGVLTVIVLIVSAVLPDDALGAGKGNERKGKYFFKKVCKECHGQDGSAAELTPMSKTAAQWEAFFAAGKHGDKALSEVVEEENIVHIEAFLVNHAADSDQPETCG